MSDQRAADVISEWGHVLSHELHTSSMCYDIGDSSVHVFGDRRINVVYYGKKQKNYMQ